MPFSASGHLEAELVALVAEVLRFAVHVVAVRAVKLVLIVRGDVRIRRLDVLRLLNEVLRVVALRARLDVGRGGIGLVGAVAGFARQTHGGVAVGAELAVGGSGRASCEDRTHEHDGERTEVFHGILLFFDFCFGDAPSGPGARVSTLYDTRELKARVISGPPTLVKQDVKYFSPQEVRERECALAVAGGRTNLSELARLNSENEAPLERGKTTEKSPP